MLAAWILAATVAVPIGVFHEVVEGSMVLVGDKVAGAFPAFHVARRVTPGRAGKFAFAAEEFEVNRRRGHAVFRQELFGFAELGADVVAGHEDFGGAGGVGFV